MKEIKSPENESLKESKNEVFNKRKDGKTELLIG